MELLDSIKNRRSIRAFSNQPISRDIIEDLLLAATDAPSPKNAQPWHFVVYSGAKRNELFDRIQTIVRDEINYGKIDQCVELTVRAMETAPLFIFVFNRSTERYAKEKYPIIARVIDVQSIGASIQNFLLAAHERGLGTLWICDLLDVEPIHTMLVSSEELVAAIAIGYPGITPKKPKRFPLNKVVTWLGD